MDYKQLFKKATEIVNEVDPMGLIGGGAPPDEYSEEVARILVALKNATSQEDLTKRLGDVFNQESILNVSIYAVLAEKLIILKEKK